VHVAVVANEFLDPALGRVGGFGWAASRAIEALRTPGSGVDRVTVLPGTDFSGPKGCRVLGAPTVRPHRRRRWNQLRLLGRRPDVMLCVDYRSSYKVWFQALPSVPILIWVRDPRLPEHWAAIDALRIPGRDQERVAGIGHLDTRSLGAYARCQPVAERPIVPVCKVPHLADRVPAVYGLEDRGLLLCNPDLAPADRPRRPAGAGPNVLFLGRLDPIKRPWLFLALASRLPEVRFRVVGQSHFAAEAGGWSLPTSLPPNLELLGNLDGADKYRVLADADLLVNTSVYEETPVSVLEAFAFEVPVVSLTDWGGLAERFGAHVRARDDAEAVEGLTEAVRALLEDDERRRRLGRAARCHVQTEHGTQRFLEQFRTLRRVVGF
jgi:glycosyltransferase involved in cell wall biosynthesis